MSNESRENEIDDIFKNAIEPIHTEPSERFWQNAAEDVISRGGKLNQKNTKRWKAIAFILGASLLILGYFSYKMENQLSTMERQMVTIEKVQTPGVKNKATHANEMTTFPNKTAEGEVATGKNTNSPDKEKQSVINTGNSSSSQTIYSAGVKPLNSIGHSSSNKSNTAPAATGFVFNKQSHIDKQCKKPADPAAYRSKDEIATTKNETQVNPTQQENSINSNTSTSNDSPSPDQKLTQANPENTSKSLPYVMKQIQVPTNDTTKIVPLAAADSNFSRFSISAFFSPDFMIGYKFKTTTSWGDQIENAIKTGEKQSFSYTAGIKAEYALSSRFSIGAGIGYQMFSFNITPRVMHAQLQSDGDVGYYMTTSSGLLECPYYGTTKVGDSIKMNAVSSREYLEIPLQLKYNFISKERYKLYLNLGLEANICLGEKTTMNWQDFWNESGTATANETEGSESLYASYYMGIGASYKIGKYLSFYLEPGLHEAITSLDDNTSVVISYPQLFSVTGGLTYLIK